MEEWVYPLFNNSKYHKSGKETWRLKMHVDKDVRKIGEDVGKDVRICFFSVWNYGIRNLVNSNQKTVIKNKNR